MNTWLLRFGAAFILACLCSFASPARAQTEAGVDLDVINGTHAESSVKYRFPLVPLPTFHLTYRQRNVGVFLEAVPPIGPVGYSTSAGYLPQATRLSYLVGTVRCYFSGTRWFAGLGDSVLNQRTTETATFGSGPVNLIQASRVTGTRYDFGYHVGYAGGKMFDATVALNPKLRATLHLDLNAFVTLVNGGKVTIIPTAYSKASPEHGSQIDSSIRWSFARRSTTLSYGLRYINYTAAYDLRNNLADRNSFLMPFIGISRRLGN